MTINFQLHDATAIAYSALRNKTLRVLTDKTFSSTTSDPGAQLFSMLRMYTQLKYQIVVPNAREADDNGIFNRTSGNWSGLLGYLQRNEADLILKQLSLSDDRLYFFDFLPAVSFEQYGFHISDDVVNENYASRNDSILSIVFSFENSFGALNRIFVPFLTETWIGIIATFVIVVIQCVFYEYAFNENKVGEENWQRSQSQYQRQRYHQRRSALWQQQQKCQRVDDDDEEYYYTKLYTGSAASKHRTLRNLKTTSLKLGEALLVGVDQMARPLFDQYPTMTPGTAATQVMVCTWCLTSVLITALYSANLTTIFGAAPPLKSPFNNISSLYTSNYKIILSPASSSEQLLRNLEAGLHGTSDGDMLSAVMARSQPYWSRRSEDYEAQLRRLPLPPPKTNTTVVDSHPAYDRSHKFALLSGLYAKNRIQSDRCDLRTHQFFYPNDINATVLVPIPLRGLSYAMPRHSPFTKPLTHLVQEIMNMGGLRMLKSMEWIAAVRARKLSNGEKYGCDDRQLKQQSVKHAWAALTFRGMYPAFTLLASCYAITAFVFGLERLAHRVKHRRRRWRRRILRAVRRHQAVERFKAVGLSKSVAKRSRVVNVHVKPRNIDKSFEYT